MCFDYDEIAEVLSQEIRTARKVHKCTCCNGEILPKHQYIHESYLYEGKFEVQKACRRCCYDIARIVAHELDEGCSWYEAWPALLDVGDYLAETQMGRTIPESLPAFDLKAMWSRKLVDSLRTKTPEPTNA